MGDNWAGGEDFIYEDKKKKPTEGGSSAGQVHYHQKAGVTS